MKKTLAAAALASFALAGCYYPYGYYAQPAPAYYSTYPAYPAYYYPAPVYGPPVSLNFGFWSGGGGHWRHR